ncbi:MAG: hypothetical protein JXR97_13115 [Planctomycetes bacterium]|nr:hypothetical protein [Planctomycetota bacterium]
MSKTPHTFPSYVSNGAFVVGLLSAICMRVLIIIKDLAPDYFRLTWYAGIMGYLMFFAFRFFIARKRRKAIIDFGLVEKMEKGESLSAEDRDVAVYLLRSLTKSREVLNYLFIFALSALAIMIDILLHL